MSNATLLNLIIVEAAISVVVGSLLFARGWRWSDIPWHCLIRGCFLGCLLLVPVYLAVYVVILVLHASQVEIVHHVVHTHVDWWMIGLVCLCNPVFEEVIALGYLFRRLEGYGPTIALSFGILMRFVSHLGYGFTVDLYTAVPIGVCFGVAYWRYRYLWPFVVAHALADAIPLIFTPSTHHSSR